MNRAQLRALKKRKGKHQGTQRPYPVRPNLAEIQGVFNHIEIMFDQLRTGFVDSMRGKPIMSDGQGGLHEIAPALLGWVELWDRIATKFGFVLDTRPLTILANRLQYDTPLTMDLIEKSQAVIDRCRFMYARLDVYEVRAMVNTQCIGYEMEELKKERMAA